MMIIMVDYEKCWKELERDIVDEIKFLKDGALVNTPDWWKYKIETLESILRVMKRQERKQ